MYAVNYLPLIDSSKSTTGCCTLIEPSEWDKQTFEFDNKLFAKAQTRSIMHIPLNMSSVMRKAQQAIDDVDAAEKEWIILSKEVSPWKAEHYFAVTRDVPVLDMEHLSGTFMTKVFEGPFKNAGEWYEQLVEFVKDAGKTPVQTYFFYTTCPNCSKTYGKNYVVGFAQVAQEK